MYGELIPLGGGDPIPLLKKILLVGRRESCDIVLRFSNVSAHHCQLSVVGGYLDSLQNLQTVGRNGMHRYNNMDHSMLTGMLAARVLAGSSYDLWTVNTEHSHHEELPSE